MSENDQNNPTRREFLKASGAVAAGAIVAPLVLPTSVHAAAAPEEIRVGLIGCGGRGTGAAFQALNADPGVVLVAMGDAFKSQIDNSLKALTGEAKIAPRVRVSPEKQFVGLDCYKKVIDSGVDVVLLASPPGFRWREIRAAVDAGKHLFAEKPCATDAAGVRSVLESTKIATQKRLSFVAGFCWRYEYARREFYKRVHEGAIGDVRHVHATYLAGPVKPMPPKDQRPAGISDVEWQIRNWYNFTWLSGDGLVEQACHSVDKIMWAMKDKPPVRCTGNGGRVNANNEGNIFDHIDVFYEWDNGVRATISQRQIPGAYSENSDYVLGSKGEGYIRGWESPELHAGSVWKYEGPKKDMYQIEHDELFASIRAGRPINNGERMAISSMAAIMGRNAAYTGQQITWDQAMNSQWNLFPDPLTWDMSLAIEPMAIPGQTPMK